VALKAIRVSGDSANNYGVTGNDEFTGVDGVSGKIEAPTFTPAAAVSMAAGRHVIVIYDDTVADAQVLAALDRAKNVIVQRLFGV
jgi:hypothetical protein